MTNKIKGWLCMAPMLTVILAGFIGIFILEGFWKFLEFLGICFIGLGFLFMLGLAFHGAYLSEKKDD